MGSDDTRRSVSRRRTILAGLGGLALTGGVAGATPGKGRKRRRGRGSGFPPAGITTWATDEDGDRYTASVGDGELSTFASVTPSERPKYLGVHLTRAALSGLPSAADLEASGEGLTVHGAQSEEFFLPFPEAAPDPFTVLGFYWNPEGHPPPGTYDLPHFDVHFHFEPESVVEAIQPGTPEYPIPDDRMPEGYVRLPNPAGEFDTVIHMGEHLGDPTAPELNGVTFGNTLIWGAHDVDDDGVGELTFVEPMVTVDYLSSLAGVDRRPIAQPTVYPQDGWYPTSYTVRDLGADGVAVVLEKFRRRSV
ncbi:hypothetical protein [Halorientalis pallida]|uniref:hypothetical protein n=1 Tax=Halorientalis pallida TaxID=2479928 RepID=UPI001D11F417|nr:hypothetical protein [Halorientalis pallida]